METQPKKLRFFGCVSIARKLIFILNHQVSFVPFFAAFEEDGAEEVGLGNDNARVLPEFEHGQKSDNHDEARGLSFENLREIDGGAFAEDFADLGDTLTD